ncbi:hypothetical protein ANCCEY_01622 [Ancylostoma ceylanicum]|uniref:CUB domain-containing protein n=1 Tax=Ancylostoma ceylanicum TaxID=53326 RepID=A0A0D6M5D1_9BILA|nr:hypothetical protein ANCCEY_01622 [Ancylostoma ceylanicum]
MTRTIYNKKKQGDYFRCTNWLMSPPNTKIEVEVLEVATPPDWFAQGCIIAGIEVKTNADQRLTGYRFCSGDDANIKLQSESNFVPLITYSMHTTRRLNVTLRYRYGRPLTTG